ncbi:TetR/AcrR family transcriptional regulator [Embleya sp. NPDC050154]|uniref:TetR/AcrR family transcriptional regulator n=1 Tax=unclassified Embleya TaxID=2699296 RepID=UPI0037A791F2
MSPSGQGRRDTGSAGQSPRPAARPGRPDKRQAIVEAAKRVFLRYGFTDTSVDVIAAEAGASKQTVYNHFGDKKTLFVAVVETAQRDAANRSVARFAALFHESGDLEHDLRAAARIWTELVLDREMVALRRVIVAEQWRHPELAEEWARPRPAFDEAVAREIGKYVEAGVLDIPDVPLATHQLVLLTAHEAIHRSRDGLHEVTSAEIGRIVDDGVRMWLRSYRARP